MFNVCRRKGGEDNSVEIKMGVRLEEEKVREERVLAEEMTRFRSNLSSPVPCVTRTSHSIDLTEGKAGISSIVDARFPENVISSSCGYALINLNRSDAQISIIISIKLENLPSDLGVVRSEEEELDPLDSNQQSHRM
jgi:hypothetical protein